MPHPGQTARWRSGPLAVAALLALGACGPSAPLPPDAGSIFGGGPDGSSRGSPDAGVGAADAAPVAIDAAPLEPDAALGCDSDPEPDTEATAQFEGTITDCDDEGTTVTGTLDGSSDLDVFRIATEDTFSCRENPVAVSRTAPDMCLFIDCDSAEVTCDEGVPQRSPAGLRGCCGARVEMTMNCSGVDDAPDFYVIASGAEEGACTSYSVDVHY